MEATRVLFVLPLLGRRARPLARDHRLVRRHGVEPNAAFPAFVDVDTFLRRPPRALPERPQALFVGVLVERLRTELPEQTRWDPRLETPQIAEALDKSSVLVLPSRSEGLLRIVIEALCRGRPVLATPVGGVPDMVEDGVNGFLAENGEPPTLAVALVRVVGLPEALEPVAADARDSVQPWLQSPQEFATRIRDLATAANALASRQAEGALAEAPVALH